MATTDDAIPRRRPVVDFDLFAATTRAESDATWDAVRSRCPVGWTEHYGGYWVVSRYEEVAAAFRDWEHFSSARTEPDRCAITITGGAAPLLIPEELDPPSWHPHRRILATLLSPQASERLRPRAAHWVSYHLDQVIESGRCELARDLTCPIPAAVTLEWLGFPPADWQMISDAFHDIAAYSSGTPEHRQAQLAFIPVIERIGEELQSRWREPRDDAMTALAYAEIDGERVSEDVARSLVFMVVGGGVDTTTSLMGAAFVHLCRFPVDRQRLLDDPELLPIATEEFLRYYPPARTHARTVVDDVELGGCLLRAGERVLLSEISAGRDDTVFDDADRFVVDRMPNRHLSFGMGIHRCPGSHLARIEFDELMKAVLRRMPDFDLEPDGVEEYPDWAMIGGWRRLQATFTPGPREGRPAD
jgi:cytochrome P450